MLLLLPLSHSPVAAARSAQPMTRLPDRRAGACRVAFALARCAMVPAALPRRRMPLRQRLRLMHLWSREPSPHLKGDRNCRCLIHEEMLSRPGSSSSSTGSSNARRPGSSAGLHSRTPSSSSWRPVVAVEQQESAHGRSAAGGCVGPSAASPLGAAGAASDGEASDGESEALPAEDPYVRLLRERDREWRGRTLQMMSGGEDGEGGSLVDRYVRLGR
jgi:hypothetical protein